MNRDYNYKVLSKNSKQLHKNLQNTTGDYFFAPLFTSTIHSCNQSNHRLYRLNCATIMNTYNN